MSLNLTQPLRGYGRYMPALARLSSTHFLRRGLVDCLLLNDSVAPLRNLIGAASPGTTTPAARAVNELLSCPCPQYTLVGDTIDQGSVGIPETGSLSIWARPNWAWNDGAWHTFFSVALLAGNSFQFRLIKFTDNNIYAGWVANSVGTNVIAPGSLLLTGWWNHLVFTWVPSSSMFLYINGNLAGTAVMDSFWDTTGITRRIGKFTDGTNVDNGFDGRLSFFQLWNRELNPSEIRLLWEKPFDHFDQPAPRLAAAFSTPAIAGAFQVAWVRPGVIIGGGIY